MLGNGIQRGFKPRGPKGIVGSTPTDGTIMKITAFYSDPHFGHKNIIKYAGRPFSDVTHMTEVMIKRYNAKIGPDDTVMWLGDCAFTSGNKFKEIMTRLNGRKFLIVGNHDDSPAKMVDRGFDLVMDECFMQIAGRTCRLKHYPYDDKRFNNKAPPLVPGEILIHGHTHSAEKWTQNMIHVGCDAWDCEPVLYDEIESLVHLITKCEKENS